MLALTGSRRNIFKALQHVQTYVEFLTHSSIELNFSPERSSLPVIAAVHACTFYGVYDAGDVDIADWY